MCGKRLLRVFCLIGLMTCAACSSRPKDASETETTLTLFPVQEENNEAEMNTPEMITPEPTPTMTPEPTPTQRLTVPENIVDTSKEPYTYEEMCEDLGWLSYAYPDRLSYEMAVQRCRRRINIREPLPISEFAGVWERNKEVPVAVACQVLVDREESRE